MTQRPRAGIEAALLQKGFRREPGGDHRYYRLWADGRKSSIATKISTGTGYKEYGDSLLGMMARQLHLTKGDLLRLVDCDLDGPGYVAMLRTNGVRL